MEHKDIKKELQRMLQKCPQCLTPRKVYSYTPLSKHKTYELIRSGELPSFIYQGTYVINKDDLLAYLLNHINDVKSGYMVKEDSEGENEK